MSLLSLLSLLNMIITIFLLGWYYSHYITSVIDLPLFISLSVFLYFDNSTLWPSPILFPSLREYFFSHLIPYIFFSNLSLTFPSSSLTTHTMSSFLYLPLSPMSNLKRLHFMFTVLFILFIFFFKYFLIFFILHFFHSFFALLLNALFFLFSNVFFSLFVINFR